MALIKKNYEEESIYTLTTYKFLDKNDKKTWLANVEHSEGVSFAKNIATFDKKEQVINIFYVNDDLLIVTNTRFLLTKKYLSDSKLEPTYEKKHTYKILSACTNNCYLFILRTNLKANLFVDIFDLSNLKKYAENDLDEKEKIFDYLMAANERYLVVSENTTKFKFFNIRLAEKYK